MEGTRVVDDPRIEGTLVMQPFSPRELMTAMAAEAPVTADDEVLGRLEARAGFSYAGDTAELTDLEGRLDDSRFEGEATVGLGETTLVRAQLKIDAVDVDRYLPPETETAASDDAPAATTTELPVESLEGLDVEAGLAIGEVTVMGLKITDTKAELKIKDRRLELNPVAAAMYGGDTTMSMVLNGRQSPPTFRLEQRLDGVNLKPLLNDFAETEQISGTAVSRMKVSSRGDSSDALVADLDGTVSFAVEDARLEGINLWYEISRAYALIKQEPAPEKTGSDTVFKDFKGSANIRNGVARTDDLEAGTPFLSLTGKGKMSLVDSTLDYKLAATVLSTAKDPETGEVSDIAGRSIPIRVTGTLDNPKVLPDMEAIVKSEAEDLIKDQLNLDKDKSLQESLEEEAMDKLKKLFD
jgi:AsmA protein